MSRINTLPNVHLLAEPTGAICNLRCNYCFFQSKKTYLPGSTICMSDALLESDIHHYIEVQKVTLATIA